MQVQYYGPVSVSVSACYKLELYGKDWTIRRFELPPIYPTLCCNQIRVSLKIRVLPSGTLSQTLDSENFARASRSCFQQNSSTVKLVDHTRDGRRVVAGRI